MTCRHHGFSARRLFPIALTAIAFAITGCSSNSLPIGEVPDGARTDTAAGTGGAGTGGMNAGSGGMTGAGSGGMTGAGSGGIGTGGTLMTDASPMPETAPSTDAADSGRTSDAPAGEGGTATGCEKCLKYKQCCLAITPGAANCSPALDFCLSWPGPRDTLDSDCMMRMEDTLVRPRTNLGAPVPAACL
ncbi:MAG TPA: hypothetical protein VNO55_18060 [Polyangia bacterium]|nr:hypothetical protein [Polyangia bacterium]